MGYGSSTTTVTNTPAPPTPAQLEAERLRLEELRRQNDLAERLLPGQQANIALQNRLIQWQLDHVGDLDEVHRQQLALVNAQLQSAISEEAMRQELRPVQLEFLRNQNSLAVEQIGAMREQNRYILENLQDQSRRLAARNAAYSPEEEAQAAAEEARRATRMGAISEEAAQIQLENLKRGNKPTDEELANINEAYDAAQATGESDIKKFLLDTQRQINEEAAQAAGLRATDSPVVRLSERAGEEAARQQGQLTRSVESGRATARLNYPLAAGQFTANAASTLQNRSAGAANFQDQLRLQAAANRNAAFSLPSSVGFATPQGTPNFGMPGAPGLNLNPNAFQYGFNNWGESSQTTRGSRTPTLGEVGQFAQGVGSLIGGFAAMSDRRLKVDVKRIGTMPSGLPIYEYKYAGDSKPQVGVMAHEAKRLFPDAVVKHPSGYLAVDYSKVA